MAEIYPLGQNRIFYRPQGFVTGLNVTVDVTDPNLQNPTDTIQLIEFRDGLYYFDYTFFIEGTYIGVFHEGNKKVTSQAFSTRKIPATGEFKLRGGNRGPNVMG